MKNWLKTVGLKTIKTMAQTAIGVIGSSLVISDIDWLMVASASVVAGVVSILTSVAGLPEIKEDQTYQQIMQGRSAQDLAAYMAQVHQIISELYHTVESVEERGNN